MARHHLGLSLIKKARAKAMKPPRLLRNVSNLQLPDVSESRQNRAIIETYNAPKGKNSPPNMIKNPLYLLVLISEL